MIIKLCSGLGREITRYHSPVVPRAQELIQLTVGSNEAVYKVIGIRYLVNDEKGDTVDLEVLPVNSTAAQYSSEQFYSVR